MEVTVFDRERQMLLSHSPVDSDGVWIAGGALTSIFSANKINDIDLYFSSEDRFASAVESIVEDGSGWCVDITKRAVTFGRNGDPAVQLMHFDWFERPQDIFEAFDFTCCMAALESRDGGMFTLHDNFLLHLAQRYLSFEGRTRYPLGTLQRVLKYIDRGYWIGKGDMVKIGLACRDIRLETMEDLADAIGGQYGERVLFGGDGDSEVPYNFELACEYIGNEVPYEPSPTSIPSHIRDDDVVGYIVDRCRELRV